MPGEGETMISVSEETMELLYWVKFPEWYTKEMVNGKEMVKLKPDAPERIRQSFEKWEKQKDE